MPLILKLSEPKPEVANPTASRAPTHQMYIGTHHTKTRGCKSHRIQGTKTPNVCRDKPHQRHRNHTNWLGSPSNSIDTQTPPTTLKLPSPSSHYHPYKAPTLPDNHLRHHNPQLYTKTPPHKLPSQHHYQQTLLLHPTKPHTAIVTPITHKQLPDKLHLQSLTTSFNNARTTPIPIFLLYAHHYIPTSPHHWQRH